MEYQIQLKQVASQTTAVVRERAKLSELSEVVPRLCGEVWEYARASGLPRPGRHVALYLDGEINLEVGAEMGRPFTGNDRVVCSSTPAGRVAMTEHVGPYNRLGEAHKAVCRWCEQNGHTPAGPCWEIYGHWTDDVSKLTTEVYYLLQPAGEAASQSQGPRTPA
jgi:effector-binding domain-containing protein